MVWGSLPLWAKILGYVYLIGGLFIYTMLSRIKLLGIPLIKERDKILISVFYPAIIALSLVALPVLLIAFFFTPLKSKVINIRINKIKHQ